MGKPLIEWHARYVPAGELEDEPTTEPVRKAGGREERRARRRWGQDRRRRDWLGASMKRDSRRKLRDEELARIARMLEAAGANALWGRGDDAARLVFEALERVESLSRSLR